MTERALRVLEFVKIRERLAAFALTDPGQSLCRELVPQSELGDIQRAQQETEEATVILTYLGSNPLTGFTDVRPYLSLAE